VAQRAFLHLASREAEFPEKRAASLLKLGQLYLLERSLRSRVRIFVPPPPPVTPPPDIVDLQAGAGAEEEGEGDDAGSLSVDIFDEDIYDSDGDSPKQPKKDERAMEEEEEQDGVGEDEQSKKSKKDKGKDKEVIEIEEEGEGEGDTEDKGENEEPERDEPDDELVKDCKNLGLKAIKVFRKAHKLHEDHWVYPYMMAKAGLKVHRTRGKILEWLDTAMTSYDKAQGRNKRTRLLEPLYKLHSTRLKYLRIDLESRWAKSDDKEYALGSRTVCEGVRERRVVA
jgi:hypothetical protein